MAGYYQPPDQGGFYQPFVHNYVKVVNEKLQVPLRATFFGGILGLILGLLVLIRPTASGALFSLAVASNYLAWGMPVLLAMTSGRSRFIPGPFYPGDLIYNTVNIITLAWIGYTIVMCMFPASNVVDKESMNYTVVINVGIWVLSLVYYYVYGYRYYTGPKSNLGSEDKYASSEVLIGDEAVGDFGMTQKLSEKN